MLPMFLFFILSELEYELISYGCSIALCTKLQTRHKTNFAVFIMAARNINSITHIPDVQNSLLGNFNRADYINLRLAGVHYMNLPPQLVQQYLGAACKETFNNQPCNNGPRSMVIMRHCDELSRFRLHPRMGHDVCERCKQNEYQIRLPIIQQNLRSRLTIQCKRCSQMQRRLDPNPPLQGHEACDCNEHINAGWKCGICYRDVMWNRFGVGRLRSDLLLRCHKVTDKRTKRKVIVNKNPRRTREACPTRNCGAVPWTSPAFHRVPGQPISHPQATFMCLNCDGVAVFPVGHPTRP